MNRNTFPIEFDSGSVFPGALFRIVESSNSVFGSGERSGSTNASSRKMILFLYGRMQIRKATLFTGRPVWIEKRREPQVSVLGVDDSVRMSGTFVLPILLTGSRIQVDQTTALRRQEIQGI